MKDRSTDSSRARKIPDRMDLPITNRAFDRQAAVIPDDYDSRDELVWEQVSNGWGPPPPSKWVGRLVFAALGGVLAVGAMLAFNYLRANGNPLSLETAPAIEQPAQATGTVDAPPDSPASEPLPDLPVPPPLDAASASATLPEPVPPAPAVQVPSSSPSPSARVRPAPAPASATQAPAASPVVSAPTPTLGRSLPATPSLRSTPQAAPIRSTQPTALPGPRPPLSQTARRGGPDPDLDPPLAAWRAGFATAPPAVNQVAPGSLEAAAAPATQESRATNAPGTRFPGPTEVRLPGTNEVRLPGVNEVRLPRANDVRLPASPEARAPAPVETPQTPVPQARVTSEEPRPAVSTPPARTPAASEAPAASAAIAPRTPAAPAATPPARRAEPAVAGGRAAETTAIEGTLARYRDAFNKLDVGAAARVWPSVNNRNLSKAFEQLRQQQVSFDQCQIDVRDVRAEARCSGTARYVPRVGSSSTQTDQRQWRFNLAKRGDEWLIQSVEAR